MAARSAAPSQHAIALLPLPPSVIRKLNDAGIAAVGDLDGLSHVDLATELGVSVPEAANSFQLYPRLARDGAMMCGTDIGPVGTTQSIEEAAAAARMQAMQEALAQARATTGESEKQADTPQ